MTKQTFSCINVKAAAITGAIVGFLCWLLVIPYGFSGYGAMSYMMRYGGYANYVSMGYMMGNYPHNSNVTFGYMMNGVFHPYNGTGYYMTMDVFHNYSLTSVVIDILLGALAGIAIAVIYNWALKVE